MRLLKKYSILLLLFAVLFCCFIAIGSLTRDQESSLLTSYVISFIFYLFILYLLLIKKVPIKLSYLLILAVILRLGLFFSYPNLSDDFFRFSWDGNVFLAGG